MVLVPNTWPWFIGTMVPPVPNEMFWLVAMLEPRALRKLRRVLVQFAWLTVAPVVVGGALDHPAEGAVLQVAAPGW